MSIVNTLSLESNRQIKINFDGGDLSSDAGRVNLRGAFFRTRVCLKIYSGSQLL